MPRGISLQFFQCKLLFAIRCDTMTEYCCLFPFSPQLLTPDVVCMFGMYSYRAAAHRRRAEKRSRRQKATAAATTQTHPLKLHEPQGGS